MLSLAPTQQLLPVEPLQQVINIAPAQFPVSIAPLQQDVSDGLFIPEFATDNEAIAVLNGSFPYKSGSLPYRLIDSGLVKVTPLKFTANIWLNLSQAFSYLRRAF